MSYIVTKVTPTRMTPEIATGFATFAHAFAWAKERAFEVAKEKNWQVDISDAGGTVVAVDTTAFAVQADSYDDADIRAYWSVAEVPDGNAFKYDTKDPKVMAAHAKGEETALKLNGEGSFSIKYVAMACIQDAFMEYAKQLAKEPL